MTAVRHPRSRTLPVLGAVAGALCVVSLVVAAGSAAGLDTPAITTPGTEAPDGGGGGIDVGDIQAAETTPPDPFANVGIDAAVEACIAGRVEASPPETDAEAASILHICGASIVAVITMLTANSNAPLDPPNTTGVPDSTLSGGEPSDTLPGADLPDSVVDTFQEALENEGIYLPREKVACFAQLVLDDPDADFDDFGTLGTLLTTCDVSLADLAPTTTG